MAMELSDYSESNSLFPFFVPQRKVIFVPGKGQGCGIDLLSRSEEETEVKSYDSFERSNFERGIQFKDFSFSMVVDEAYKELEERIGESFEKVMKTEKEKPVSQTFDLTSIRDSLPKLKVHAPEKIHDEDFGAFTIYRRCDLMVDCKFSCSNRDAISPRQNSDKDLPNYLEADENMSFNSLDSSMTTTTRSSIESLPKVFYDPNLHRHQLDCTNCCHDSSKSANLVHVVPKRMEPAVSSTTDIASATTANCLFPSNRANVKQPFFQRACLHSTPVLPPSSQLNSRQAITSSGSQAMVKLVFPSPSKASSGIGLRPFSRFNSRLMNDLSKIHLSASLSALPPVTPTSDDTESCMTTSESNLYTTCSPIKCGDKDETFPIFSSSPPSSPIHTHHSSRFTSRTKLHQRLYYNHSSQSSLPSLPVTNVIRRSTRFQSSSTSPTVILAKSLKRPKNWTGNELSSYDPVTKKSCLEGTRNELEGTYSSFESLSKPASDVVKSLKRRSNSCSKMAEFRERNNVVTRSMCSPIEAKENRKSLIDRISSTTKIPLVRNNTSFKTVNRSKILDLDTLTLANTIFNSEKHIQTVESPAKRKDVTTRQQRIKFKEEVITFKTPKTRQRIERR